MISHKKNYSFIFQLYELISFYPAMQDSFLSSIHLMTEEFFYENNLKEKKFVFSKDFILNQIKLDEIIRKIIKINTKYENEIKYIMKDNCITIELELIFFNEFIETKKEVFKHDVEDYRKNLLESVNFFKKNSINDLEKVRKEYLLNYSDIKNLLFIILFWVPKEGIYIADDTKVNDKINLNNALMEGYKYIKSVKSFIEELVMKSTLYEMNNFFYENIKCFSLYFLYCIFFEALGDK